MIKPVVCISISAASLFPSPSGMAKLSVATSLSSDMLDRTAPNPDSLM